MKGKEAYDKIFDKLTYDQQQELGEEVLRIVYQDLQRLEKLEKENEELKNTILSLELDTCIPELRKENKELRKSIKSWNENAGNLLKENTKLKEALKFLCEELGIKLCYNNCYDNCMLFYEECYLDYQSDIDSRTLHRITKEKYNLLEEVISNER